MYNFLVRARANRAESQHGQFQAVIFSTDCTDCMLEDYFERDVGKYA